MYFNTAFVFLFGVNSVYSKGGKSKDGRFKNRPKSPKSRSKVYLALGDAIPAGTRNISPPAGLMMTPFGEVNYANILNQLLGERGFDQIINLSCPQETTGMMLDGNAVTTTYKDGSLCYGDNAPFASNFYLSRNRSSQLQAAKYIFANYDVGLVTITLGSSDPILNCFSTTITGAEFVTCANNQNEIVKTNLKYIINELTSWDPSIPILVSNTFAPVLGFKLPGAPKSLKDNAEIYITANFGLNDAIANAVASFQGENIVFVDLESAFNARDFSGTPSKNVVTLCETTYICTEDTNGNWIYDNNSDRVFNDIGHQTSAITFYHALGKI